MIEVWVPGLLVEAFGLKSHSEFTVLEVRRRGRGTLTLLQAPPEDWRWLVEDMERADLSASAKNAARRFVPEVRLAVNNHN